MMACYILVWVFALLNSGYPPNGTKKCIYKCKNHPIYY